MKGSLGNTVGVADLVARTVNPSTEEEAEVGGL